MLELKSISFLYDGKTLLHDVSLTFCEGRAYFIASEPDAGTSLLMKIAGGIYHPTSGSVELNGVNIHNAANKKSLIKSISSVFQQGTLISNLTVEENILLPVKFANYNYEQDQIMEQIAELFARFDIDLKVLDMRPANISSSTRKLINFIREIIIKSEIYLIDDPLFNLNSADRLKVRKALLSLKEQGETLIICSNNCRLIEELADDVIILTRGRVLTECGKGDFFESNNPEVVDFICQHIGE